MTRHSLFDKLRLGPWLVAALIMAAIVGVLYPHQLGVLLWSLTKLSFGAYLGYWIDRSLFPYARPHELFSKAAHVSGTIREESALSASRLRREASLATLRRAVIIAAALIALGLGV